MKYFIVFLFSAVSFFSNTYAQGAADFYIANVKGNVSLKCNNSWKKIYPNGILRADDHISIGSNSFINLYDRKNKKYFVIHGVRSFIIRSLIENDIETSSPVNNVLIKAFEKLANAFNSFADNRSLNEIFRSKVPGDDLIAIMPKNTKAAKDTIQFEWLYDEKIKSVNLLILDENLNPQLDTIITGNNFFWTSEKMESGKEYIWQLSSKGIGKKIINYFSIANDEEMGRIKNSMDSLDLVFPFKEMPNYHLLSGMIYEDEGFNSAAYESYKTALTLSDDKKEYGKILDQFFSRQKINLKYNDVLSLSENKK